MELRIIAGWEAGSGMPAIYVHMSGSHPPARTGDWFRLIGKYNLFRLYPPDKASDRALMHPVTVALFPHPNKKPILPSGRLS